MVIGVQHPRQIELSRITEAEDRLRLGPGFNKNRDQQTCEDGNHRDDDQQFNQCECPELHFGGSAVERRPDKTCALGVKSTRLHNLLVPQSIPQHFLVVKAVSFAKSPWNKFAPECSHIRPES